MDKSLVFLSAAAAAGVAAAVAKSGFSAPGAADSSSGGGDDQGGFDILGEILNAASEFGMVRVSAMRGVDQGLLSHPNVQAFLRVIRSKESNQTPGAYQLIVGGKTFASFADHPRIYGVCWTDANGRRQCSSAAGAYQLTASTWDETRQAMGLADFSPRNQDLAALGRIAARGALNDVLNGRLDAAIKKLRLEWEAFSRWPEVGPYQQIFMAYGGSAAGSVLV